MKTTRLPAFDCPTCGKKCDAVTTPEGDYTPEPGDFTICIGCQDVLCFTDSLELRNVTEADACNLPTLLLSRYQLAITLVKKRAKAEAMD